MSGVIKGYFTTLSGPVDANNVTVTAIAGNKIALDVNVAGGSSTISGAVNIAPPKSQRVTTMDVGDVALALPVAAFSSRITFSVHNLSGLDTLYISTNPLVEANRDIGTLAGWEIGPGETLNEDLDVGTVYYGVTESGKTVRIKIKEGSSV